MVHELKRPPFTILRRYKRKNVWLSSLNLRRATRAKEASRDARDPYFIHPVVGSADAIIGRDS
jgi:hypothetical protein